MSTTPTLISIVNASSRVTDDEVAAAMHAFGVQLARDFSPIWGATPGLEFCPSGTQPSGNVLATISDTPDVDGALGYHDETADGQPYIKVFVVDGYDWRTTMSHELLELIGDPGANRWADSPDGDDHAFEMCDATEADSYEIDGVPVSNFLYPAFFNPDAAADDKLDHLGVLTAPFSMSSGGYQIKRTEPGQISQVFARHEATGHEVVEAVPSNRARCGRSVLVVFSPGYPEAKKAGKVAKVVRRYSR